jgi:hypothetical protein
MGVHVQDRENAAMAKRGAGSHEPTKPGDADRINLGLEGRPPAPSVSDHVIHPSGRHEEGKHELTTDDLKPKRGGHTPPGHETQPSHPPAEEVEKFMRDPSDVRGDVDLT